MDNTLKKAERLTSRMTIEKLFAGGNASMAAFPLRIVFMKVDRTDGRDEPPVSILVSVPKRRFRHAVDRNRVKRLVREAYRRNKYILWNALADKDYRLVAAFVCITDTLPTYNRVVRSMRKNLLRVAERL